MRTKVGLFNIGGIVLANSSDSPFLHDTHADGGGYVTFSRLAELGSWFVVLDHLKLHAPSCVGTSYIAVQKNNTKYVVLNGAVT